MVLILSYFIYFNYFHTITCMVLILLYFIILELLFLPYYFHLIILSYPLSILLYSNILSSRS